MGNNSKDETFWEFDQNFHCSFSITIKVYQIVHYISFFHLEEKHRGTCGRVHVPPLRGGEDGGGNGGEGEGKGEDAREENDESAAKYVSYV